MKTVRASSLPMLFNCKKQHMHRTEAEDYGQEAGQESAQTGSLVHLGIATYHATNDTREGTKAIERGAAIFPLADVKKALAWFYKYPAKFAARNFGEVRFVEEKITFSLPGTKKQAVAVIGTVDLVLESPTEFIVIDHKSGQSPPDYMLRQYAPQIAAYMMGISVKLGKRNKKPIVGYISRLQDLHFTDGRFYHPIGFDLAQAGILLKQAGALYEMYEPVSSPGKHCEYCPLNFPQCFMTPEGTGGSKEKIGRMGRQALTTIDQLFKSKKE